MLLFSDSSDYSDSIDPEEFYFEPKKVRREGKTIIRKDGGVVTRRTGILIADTDEPKTPSKADIKTEIKKNATKQSTTMKEKTSAKDTEKEKDEKTVMQKNKPKRKKVLRVRVRGRNSNKTDISKDKSAIKQIEKTKLIPMTTTTPKPKIATVIKIPKVKSATITDSDSKPKEKPTEVPLQKEVSQSSKKPKVDKKKKTVEPKLLISNEPGNKGNFVTFFRRTGPKDSPNSEAPEYIDPNWVSTFKRENQDEDDSSYILNFNYMGNDQDLLKDKSHIPQISTPQKTQLNSPDLHQKNPGKVEVNIGHLEEIAGKLLEKQKIAAHTSIYHQNQNGYYGPETDFSQFNDNSEYEEKSLEDSSVNDKSSLEKQYTPTVTLKKKQTHNHKEPVWQLQAQKKKNPTDQPKRIKLNTDHKNPKSFKFGVENAEWKPSDDKTDHFSKSFINLPGIGKVNIDHKKPFQSVNFPDTSEQTKSLNPLEPNDEQTGHFSHSFIKLPREEKENIHYKKAFQRENLKEISEQKKPLIPLENKGDGNYFIHMYKKVGNIENFQMQAGERPGNMGYLSSLKLSWTDDDTNAKVEEALDSRAFMPIDHIYSAESTESRGESDTDVLVPQPSESTMQYRPYYVDEFISPLRSDKFYHFHNAPVIHRHKRSTVETPRQRTHVSTHFKIGDSNIENNYTLEYRPKTRFSSERIRSEINGPKTSLSRPLLYTQPRNSDGEQIIPTNKQTRGTVEIYHLKPIESRGIKELKSALNITDIFDRYQKPSRGVTNIQVFRSYHTPDRDPKNAHNITYFHKDKNTKMEIQVTDRVSPGRVATPGKNLNIDVSRNADTFNNFKETAERRVPLSTGIKHIYVKPEKVATPKTLNQNVRPKVTQKRLIRRHKDEINGSFAQAMIDANMTKPLTTPEPTKNSVMRSTENLENPPKKNQELQRTADVKARRITKTPDNQARSYKGSAKPKISNSKNVTKSVNNTIRYARKNGDVKTKTQRTPQAASTILATRTDEKPNVQTRTDKATKKLQSTSRKIKDLPLILRRVQIQAKTDHEPRTVSDIRSRQVDDDDDDTWFYPQRYADEENQSLQEDILDPSDDSIYAKKQINNHHQDANLFANNHYEQSLNGIAPPFQFQDPRLHQSPEKNYPRYHSIPKTHFTCKGRAPGYYADPETECQVSPNQK